MIGRWGGVLLVAGFAAVVLGPALLGHGVLIDVDLLTQRPPWGVAHPTSAILCRSDPIDFYLPGIKNIREALWHGRLETWAPYEVGGTPLAALPNHGWLDPLSWPYLVLPLWLAPAFVKLAELVAIVVGMVGFLGRLGVRRCAGIIGGLLFFSSGFMVMWTGWPQTRVAAWIPALFWALDLVSTRRRARDVVFVAVVVACLLLGGFPAVTLFALTAGGVYVLVRSSAGPRPEGGAGGALEWALEWARGPLLALGGVVLGVALAAVQLLPFVKDLGEIGLADRTPGPHPPLGMLATSVAPNVFGTCIGGAKFGPVNPVDGTAFLGAAALVLVLCALVLPRSSAGARTDGEPPRSTWTSTDERGRWALAGVLVGTVVLVWFGGPLLALLQRLPGYDSNNIGRADSVFGFAGAALAGLGLERLLDQRPQRWSARRWVGGGVVVLLVLAVLAWVFRDARRATTNRAFFDHSLWLPLVVGLVAVVGLVVAVGLRGIPRMRQAGVAVIVVAALGQSAWFAHQQLPTSPRSAFYPTTDVQRYLEQHLGHDRWAPSGKVAIAATADWWHLRTPLGHEFTQPQWKALLEQVAPGTMRTATYSQFPSTLTLRQVAASHALDLLSVRYWVTGPGQHSPGPTMPVVLSSPDATIFERTTALPRIRWEAGSRYGLRPARPTTDGRPARPTTDGRPARPTTDGRPARPTTDGRPARPTTDGRPARPTTDGRPARPAAVVDVVRDDPGHISVDVDSPAAGRLVVADAVVRAGWTATVDGHPATITRAEGAFGAVDMAAGKHRVTLVYRPPGLAVGVAVSGGALLVVVGLLTAAGVRRRRRTPLDSAS